MRSNQILPLLTCIAFTLGFYFALAIPVQAQRYLEWRSDGLWVIEDLDEYFFEPVGDLSDDSWVPRVASMSPDNEWVAFVRHTGGGFEDEGQSLYAARWDGEDERLMMESDWLISDIYWLQTDNVQYVITQQHSGGTLFHSFFSVLHFDTGNVITRVEGMIYGVSHGGTRYAPIDWRVPTGLRYEVLGEDEEPSGWGIFYVDELVELGAEGKFSSVDEMAASESPLTDGFVMTAWLGHSEDYPSVTVEIAEGETIRGLGFQSGWQWHIPPGANMRPWEGRDLFPLYDRPCEIVIEPDGGDPMTFTLVDRRSVQWAWFEEEITGGSFTVTVMSVYPGSKTHQCAIGEMYAL